MIAREYIDKNLQPLPANDTVELTLNYLLQHQLSQAFIFKDDKTLNLIKLNDIFFQDKERSTIEFSSEFTLKLTGDLHWSQFLGFFKLLNLEILPVYSLNYEFVGFIQKASLIANLNDLNYLEEPGAIIMLECSPNFYAASEVVRIAEMYNGRIIALFTHFDVLTQKLIITLKLNLQETRGLSNTFERFGYDVIHIFMNKDLNDEVYTERYESLLRTLDIK